jgi:hypothetical protein
MEYIIGYQETKNEEEINVDDNEMNTNEESIEIGSHIYGKTVSQLVDSSSMLDFIGDIFLQYKQGKLPKTSKEETEELLKKWFDGSIKDVESQLYEQSVTTSESDSEQRLRNLTKRQRVDSDV